jgi:hypothetical protein
MRFLQRSRICSARWSSVPEVRVRDVKVGSHVKDDAPAASPTVACKRDRATKDSDTVMPSKQCHALASSSRSPSNRRVPTMEHEADLGREIDPTPTRASQGPLAECTKQNGNDAMQTHHREPFLLL